MNDLTLESLAKRVEALEQIIATKEPDQSRKDWRKVVGMFRESEFMRRVDEECLRVREAERKAAARRVGRMILLDTDHTTFLKYPDSERGRRMIDRLNAVSASEVIGVAIVTVEERMRGWLAVIAKEKSSRCDKSSVIASWPCCSSSTRSSKSCPSMRLRPGSLMISAGRSFASAQGT